MTKFIFVTGGVISSLGKGIAAASIGALLEDRGYKITLQKFDPYLNVDPGTMSPFQHGEVYVADDGTETDLDLGHYERFTSSRSTKFHNQTAGKIYNSVLTKERRGDYLGKTVQVIPHVTDEIKHSIKKIADDADVLIAEIGGTVGDIESLPFLEAIRQFGLEHPRDDVLYIHLTYVPYIKAADELKSKPTQHSVKQLREIGIQPDIILCRTDRELPESIKDKIALFCNIRKEAVFEARDVSNIYFVPIMFEQQGLDNTICQHLALRKQGRGLKKWKELRTKIENPSDVVEIGIVGKYVDYADSYKSLNEALAHAGFANRLDVKLRWFDSSMFEKDESSLALLKEVGGILIPGGFGGRGIEGMLLAIKYARLNKIPFFGICLGMQLATVEFARNVAGLVDANSTEFDENPPYRIIYKLRELLDIEEMGGNMRLGAYTCAIQNKDSFAYKAYRQKDIEERHRHRYEFNMAFRKQLEEAGLKFTGISPDGKFVEIVELDDHPWYLGCQFHPEFKSKPLKPQPLFVDFIKASYMNREEKAK